MYSVFKYLFDVLIGTHKLYLFITTAVSTVATAGQPRDGHVVSLPL